MKRSVIFIIVSICLGSLVGCTLPEIEPIDTARPTDPSSAIPAVMHTPTESPTIARTGEITYTASDEASLDTIKMGLTWGVASYDMQYQMTTVSCYGRPLVDGTQDSPACDSYEGDTSCSLALPVLCLNQTGLPRPNYAVVKSGGGMEPAFYRGWAGGYIGLTEPITGTDLTSLDVANELCQVALGEGYRMAEHHDGKYVSGMDLGKFYGDTWPPAEQLSSGGWTFFAYGNISDETRFWVHIENQEANCWSE